MWVYNHSFKPNIVLMGVGVGAGVEFCNQTDNSYKITPLGYFFNHCTCNGFGGHKMSYFKSAFILFLYSH